MVTCSFCKRIYPFNENSLECFSMHGVADVTGCSPVYKYYCRSDKDTDIVLSKYMDNMNRERFLKFAESVTGRPPSFSCLEMHQEAVKEDMRIKKLKADRQNYRNTHQVFCEQDFPEELRVDDQSELFLSSESKESSECGVD